MSGSKPSWTVDQVRDALVANHGIYSNAGRDIGLTGQRVGQIVRANAELLELAESLTIDVTKMAKSNIVQAILDGDTRQSAWWLEKRDPDFRPSQHIDPFDGGKIPVYNSPSAED